MISVVAARRACTAGQRMPIDANQRPGTGEAATAEDLVVAVEGEPDAEHDPHDEQRQVGRLHCRAGYRHTDE